MTDDDKSLGDQNTLGGESPEQEIDAQSLGDQSTHGDHSQMDSVGDSSSLGDQLTFGGEGTGEVLDDDMEIVNLESRYTIERVLGKGGMGEVLLATDTRLERRVAIKRILGKAGRSKTAVNRFLTEAKSVASLNHPNIVQVYDYGRDKQGPFLIMEYVAGQTLLERCQQGAIALKESIELTVQLCDGLAAAHDAHIVHRDIKPANILLTKNNIPKLTDFGLAKAEAAKMAEGGMTMAGAVLGTLDFMPPEQRKDAALVDARSDLWSLAATLYQMLTGETPRVIDLDAVPRELRTCLAKALKTNKDDRYQTSVELGTALRECLTASAHTPVTELGSGECPSCHTRNDASRKFCNECAGPLQAPCFGCKAEIPVWDKVCGQCGTNQHEKVKQLQEKRAKQRADVEQLLQAYEFDKAKKQAAVYQKRHDPRVDANNNWADEMVARIDEKRGSELKRIAEIMEEAKSHQAEFDFGAGLRALKQVPSAWMAQPVAGLPQTPQELTDELTRTAREIQRLQKIVQERLANKEYDGLLETVEQLQVLQPNRPSLNRIHEKLSGREEKLRANSKTLFLSARTFYDQRDYDECLRRISKIPARFLSSEVKTLQQWATDNREQLDQLRKRIDAQYQNQHFQGLMSLIDEYLKQQPGAEEMLKLRNQLVERDKRNAAGVAEAVQQAREMRKSCRFEEAADILGQFNPEMETIESATLFDECQNWHQDRCAAFKAMKRPLPAGGVLPPLVKRYQNALSDSALTDPEFESAYTVYKKQLTEKREAEVAAAQLQQTLIKRGIAVLALVVGVLSILLVLFIRSNLHESAIARELERGNYAAVLTLDPQNTEALAMKQAFAIKLALLYGDYQTVLALDPNNTEALATKKAVERRQQLTQSLTKGDYRAVLDLDPNNAEALAMKKEAGIKQGLAKGDYRAVLDLHSKNREALAMKKEADIKQALAKGDYRTVLGLDPNNPEALAMKKESDVNRALAHGDYGTALRLDPGNTEALTMKKEAELKRALAMKKEANIKQALAKGDYKTVLGLEPNNAEALTMKKEANIKQALADGDYGTVLSLDSKNPEALTMKKEADIKQALAEGDYRTVLGLDSNNPEALAMKKEADIKQALAEGDYKTVLGLDPDNAEALAMKEADIKQALAERNYMTVLGLDPNNAEALAMKRDRDIKNSLAEGKYQEALALDPNNGDALELKHAVASIKTALGLHKDRVNSVTFSPDGKTIASGSDDKTAKLWAGPTAKIPLREIDTLIDGKRSPVTNWPAYSWWADFPAGQKEYLNGVFGHGAVDIQSVDAVAFSPDNKIAISCGDRIIRTGRWDAGKREVVAIRKIMPHDADEYRDEGFKINYSTARLGTSRVTFSPNGQFIACCYSTEFRNYGGGTSIERNGIFVVCNRSGLRNWRFKTPTDSIYIFSGIGFSTDGQAVAVSYAKADITDGLKYGEPSTIIFDADSGRARKEILNSGEFGAFSPDSTKLLSMKKNLIKLWDAETGKELKTLTGHEHGVNSVAFSPDGKTIASGSDDHTIKLWDSKSGNLLATLEGHTHNVECLAFSPDGQSIASGSMDKTIKLWNVGEYLDTLDRIKKKYEDVTMDRHGKETPNPFQPMNVADPEGTPESGEVAKDGDFDIPRPDAVRDLVSYPAKREAMLQRKATLRPVLVDGGRVVDASRFEGFQLTAIAGKQTKLGRIYFGQQPCRGLDTLKASTASEAPFKLILPIHGQPEFSNSLCHKKGFYLAGIKVNLQDQEVVGIQAILGTPRTAAQLDMENLVTSAWAGQQTAAQQFRVDAPLGNAVYGIVVYEAKNKITGIGLVQKK